jgi:aminopeptidase N
MSRDTRHRPRTRARARAVAVTALAAALATMAGTATADPSDFEPGAAGIGDPYYPGYGNGGYDVSRYRIALRYEPDGNRIEAVTTIEAEATENLSRLNLDLVGLTVEDIEVDGHDARWSRSGQELKVTPKHGLREGHAFETTVVYSGTPVEFVLPGIDLRTGFMPTDDGVTVAGQPEVAASWFPVNDHPRDKAAYTFVVSVPDGHGVVANGTLVSQRSAQGRTTYTWRATEPMAPYLATIDIGEWDVREWTTAAGLPVYDAVDPDLVADPVLGPAINASLDHQGEMLEVLAEAFGPYPFSTVGAIVDDQPDLYFALETQTRPVYSKYFWPDYGDGVVVHELAHQWFGDHVALHTWRDIWLNEGFSTYAEWLWLEHRDEIGAAELAHEIFDAIPADDPFWDLVIGDPGTDHLFDEPVYVRGALAVHALREAVGDEHFWQILHAWTENRGGGTGTTEQLLRLAERISGQDLDAVFDAWLHTAGKPGSLGSTVASAKAAGGATAVRGGTTSPVAADWLGGLRQRVALAQRGR